MFREKIVLRFSFPLNLDLCSFNGWMLFNLVKEINRLRKKINRLLSKGMSNIYFKSYYWEIMTYSELRFFVSFKSLSPRFWVAPTHADIIKSSNFLLQSEFWEQNCVWLFYYFERILWRFKVKKSMFFLLNKNINFNVNERKSKMENPTHCFGVMNHADDLV